MQEIFHVLRRKPVLRWCGGLGPDGLRDGQHGAPEVVEKVYDQPRARMREPVQPGQQGLHVGQIIDQVGQENVVVLFLGGKLVSVGDTELQFRMTLARQVNDRRAEIDTDAAGGPDGGQKIAQAATEFQDAQTGRNQKAEVTFQQQMIMTFLRPDAPRGATFIE